jgi:hypothetical protein
VWLCGCRSSPDAGSARAPEDSVQVTKLPAAYLFHKFDPAAPPAGMPPLHPGEAAVCDADFIARSSVGGQSRRTDSTHAMLTVTKVMMTLQLQTNVWVPIDAVQTIVDHEEGHHAIAEYYYGTADKLAERIAAGYIGKRVEVTGDDLDAASSQKLLEIATEVTNEYRKEINSSPTQLLYDNITDHSRNTYRQRRGRPRHQKRRGRSRSGRQVTGQAPSETSFMRLWALLESQCDELLVPIGIGAQFLCNSGQRLLECRKNLYRLILGQAFAKRDRSPSIFEL